MVEKVKSITNYFFIESFFILIAISINYYGSKMINNWLQLGYNDL